MTPAAQWAVGASAVGVLAGLLAWMTVRGEPTKPDPENTSLVARGKAIYAQHCASCHGASLEGQPNWRKPLPNGRLPAPPHDQTGHTWHHSDNQLFDMVKNGTAAIMPGYETDMPAYRDILSDADIWAVISFIESTWTPDIRERQERMNRRNQ
jgi:S-disulfanyl-L-cysteine oxidoreductase SoxD